MSDTTEEKKKELVKRIYWLGVWRLQDQVSSNRVDFTFHTKPLKRENSQITCNILLVVSKMNRKLNFSYMK